MATSDEIKQRASALAEKTDVNSITPREVGGIMYDLASHSENVLRNGGTLGIRKVYESVAAMEADSTNPKDFWGDPIKKGNLVVIYDGTTTGVDNNKIYAFMKPGWELATKLDAAYATKAETDAKLAELGSKLGYIEGNINNPSESYIYEPVVLQQGEYLFVCEDLVLEGTSTAVYVALVNETNNDGLKVMGAVYKSGDTVVINVPNDSNYKFLRFNSEGNGGFSFRYSIKGGHEKRIESLETDVDKSIKNIEKINETLIGFDEDVNSILGVRHEVPFVQEIGYSYSYEYPINLKSGNAVQIQITATTRTNFTAYIKYIDGSYLNSNKLSSGGVYNFIAEKEVSSILVVVVENSTLKVEGKILISLPKSISVQSLENRKLVEMLAPSNFVDVPFEKVEGEYATASNGKAVFANIENSNYFNIKSFNGYIYLQSKVVDEMLRILAILTDNQGNVLNILSVVDELPYYIIEVPEECTGIYINSNTSFTPVIKSIPKKEKDVVDITNIGGVEDGFYTFSEANNKARKYDIEGCRSLILPCSGFVGDTLFVSSSVLSTTYNLLYIITDSNYNVLNYYKEEHSTNYEEINVIIPQGASYLIVNSVPSDLSVEAKIERLLTFESLYKELNSEMYSKIKGKSCCTFGDSITWYDGHDYNWGKEEGVIAVGYQSYMRKAGMNVVNQGYSGANIKNILQRIKETNVSNFDYITITSGANDSRYQIETGSLNTETSVFDTNTFIGALQEAISYILTNNPKAKVVLITPIKGWIYYPEGYANNIIADKVGKDGIVEERYANAIKEVAAYYSLPVCDWYNNSGVNIYTRDWYMNDPEPNKTAETNPNTLYSLHPGTEGYKRMADILLPILNSI